MVDVEFLVDGASARVDTTSPYVHGFQIAAGVTAMTLEVVATDTNNNATTTGELLYEVLEDTPPAITLTGPADGTTWYENETISVTVDATDDRAVSRVDFQVDGTTVTSDFGAPFLGLVPAPSGVSTAVITAVARDVQGQTATDSITVNVIPDNPPTATITSPADGSVLIEGDPLTVSADATDDRAVSRVEFWVDGSWVQSDFDVPYDYTTVVPAGGGTMTVEAIARDAVNQTGSSGQFLFTLAADPGTTVIGTVVDKDGAAVDAATVEAHGTTALSNPDGTFSIAGVSTTDGDVVVVATVVSGGTVLFGASRAEAPIRSGTTDVGEIRLKASTATLYPSPIFEFDAYSTIGFHATDLNGDALVDVVAGRGNGVSIMVGAGDGTFGVDSGFTVPGGPTYELLVGDIDNDSRADLVMVQQDGVRSALGAGDGTFATPVHSISGNWPQYGVLADFDSDGFLDVVATSPTTDELVYMPGIGDGTFGQAVRTTTGDEPKSVAVGDLNGDGNRDVVAVIGGSADLSWFAGNGNGTFAPAQTLAPLSGTPVHVTVGDLDADGVDDIVSTSNDTSVLTVFYGGVSGPGSAVTLEAGIAPNSTSLVDANADGVLDILAANDGCDLPCSSIFREEGVTLIPGIAPGGFGPEVEIRVRAPELPVGATVADTDQDGLPDILVNVDGVEVLLADGSGGFGSAVLHPTNVLRGIGAGDFDEDGFQDVVGGDGSGRLIFLCGDGTGGFDSPVSVAVGSGGFTEIVVVDIDNDGHQDVLCSHLNSAGFYVVRGSGDGTFLSTFYSAGSGSVGLDTGDLNGDGMDDVAITSRQDGFVGVLLATAPGVFGQPSMYAVSASLAQRDLKIGDVNNDGHLDVVTVGGGTQGIINVLAGAGDGTLGAAWSDDFGQGPAMMILEDINADGNLDILAAANGTFQVVTSLGAGDGTFPAPVPTGLQAGSSLSFADVDADGTKDILTYSGPLRVAPGLGGANFGPGAVFDAQVSSAIGVVVELNGDGKPDVVVADWARSGVSVMLHR